MNNIINEIFDYCVIFLQWLAKQSGMSYKAINVIIFCILWPIVTIVMLGYIIKLRRMIRTK